MNPEEKRTEVDKVVRTIQKKYGLPEDTLVIARASDLPIRGRIPTGILSLDNLLRGGFPMGQFSTVFGCESTCKTTLSYMTIAEAQKMGLVPIYINAEHKFDPEWAQVQGVDLPSLGIISPEGASAEQILDCYIEVVKEYAADLVVIDSVSALSPGAEQDRTMAEDTMALVARILSKFFRKGTGLTSKGNTCCLFIGQTRDTLSPYASKLSSLAGGHALKHMNQFILCTGRKTPQSGNNVTRDTGFIWTIDALKTTGPGEGTRLEYEFKYGMGVDKNSDIINLAISSGILDKGGGGNYTLSPQITSGEEVKVRGYPALVEACMTYMDRIKELVGNTIINNKESSDEGSDSKPDI